MNEWIKEKSNIGIKHFILLLTFLPSLLITIGLTSYLTVSRQVDAQDNLLKEVINSANYLSKASELPLFSGEKFTLTKLASATVTNQNILSVTFYDSLKQEILNLGEIENPYKVNLGNGLYKEENNFQLIVQIPVYNSEIEVDDFTSSTDKNDPIKFLGWVQIIADKTRLKEKQQSILWVGFAIGVLIFSLLALLTLSVAHSITLPLEKITTTVKKLKSGDLSARIKVVARGEMSDLVLGINQLANEVEESHEELQQKVKLATSQLTDALTNLEELNEQLKGNVIQEREQREEQEQMLLRQCRMANMGEMLDSIAHQWRQPLMHINSILMNMDYSLEKKDNDKVYLGSKIEEVTLLTSHMSQTIEDFRGLFKTELEQTEFSVDNAINDVLQLMKNGLKDIEISFYVTSEIKIISYKSELIQVVIIILSNAVDALNKEKTKNKKIHIFIQEVDNELRISFEDNAGGIEPENIATLFDPYFTTKEQTGGTGLGLYIAKIIIEQKMDGKLTVKNTAKGANFTIILKK
ncbi:MAG: ATP-binding protein [Cocleimonas sp.]